ncbi:hypothetical protein L6452_27287 [Arctium lappa]|uniref:Uncharacterized protein n=1 Tax=Arctium lappa TaxID=4217 RepID=A0ACB8ZXF6_ARCLA|nr:hypothetical protein L6452_27287 [Arctium lappa]
MDSSSVSSLLIPKDSHPKPDHNMKKNVIASIMASPLCVASFKEDTYHHPTLKSSKKKELQEPRDLLISTSNDQQPIWGIPRLPTQKSDVVLLKFLRAREFRVQDSLTMLLKCLSWRKDFGADSIFEEDLGFKELQGVVAYMNGFDRESHPVCCNAYGIFKNKEMYEKLFGDDEKLQMLWVFSFIPTHQVRYKERNTNRV